MDGGREPGRHSLRETEHGDLNVRRVDGRQKPCGHDRHVGTCPGCQRVQLARWQAQLADVPGYINARLTD
jgi:hypothetical protein